MSSLSCWKLAHLVPVLVGTTGAQKKMLRYYYLFWNLYWRIQPRLDIRSVTWLLLSFSSSALSSRAAQVSESPDHQGKMGSAPTLLLCSVPPEFLGHQSFQSNTTSLHRGRVNLANLQKEKGQKNEFIWWGSLMTAMVGGSLGLFWPFLRPYFQASFPLTGLYHPPHWEGRQKQEKWVDLILYFKDVAAGFADGGSRWQKRARFSSDHFFHP